MIDASVQLDLGDTTKMKARARLAVRIGCQRAAKPVRAAVESKASALARYGFTAKSLGTKVKLYPNGTAVTVVGPKMSYSRTKGKFTRGPRAGESRRHIPYLYSWILEKGSKRSAAKPFLRPALAEAGGRYVNEVADHVAAELAKVGR